MRESADRECRRQRDNSVPEQPKLVYAGRHRFSADRRPLSLKHSLLPQSFARRDLVGEKILPQIRQLAAGTCF